jgi:hypothetical protein
MFPAGIISRKVYPADDKSIENTEAEESSSNYFEECPHYLPLAFVYWIYCVRCTKRSAERSGQKEGYVGEYPCKSLSHVSATQPTPGPGRLDLIFD